MDATGRPGGAMCTTKLIGSTAVLRVSTTVSCVVDGTTAPCTKADRHREQLAVLAGRDAMAQHTVPAGGTVRSVRYFVTASSMHALPRPYAVWPSPRYTSRFPDS